MPQQNHNRDKCPKERLASLADFYSFKKATQGLV